MVWCLSFRKQRAASSARRRDRGVQTERGFAGTPKRNEIDRPTGQFRLSFWVEAPLEELLRGAGSKPCEAGAGPRLRLHVRLSEGSSPKERTCHCGSGNRRYNAGAIARSASFQSFSPPGGRIAPDRTPALHCLVNARRVAWRRPAVSESVAAISRPAGLVASMARSHQCQCWVWAEIDGEETMELKLESRALKASLVLDPAALAGVEVPNGLSKVTQRVAVPGKTIVAEVNAKSLCRTVAAIAAAGPNGVAVVLQGKLEPGDVLTEAGIAAQPQTPKPTPTN